MAPKSKNSKGATDVNKKISKGQTLLHLAAKSKNLAEVKRLISIGADVNLADDSKKMMPLHYAASYNKGKKYISVIEELLKNGADVNAQNKFQQTVLHTLSARAKVEVIQLLLDYNADVGIKDKYGDVPLVYAARGGNTEVVGLLLKLGYDVNSSNLRGKTLLHFAAGENIINSHFNTIELLLNSGADVNAQSKDGNTPLHCLFNGPASVEIVKLFLNFKADVKIKNYNSITPIYNAGQNNNLEVLQLLIDHGSDVNNASSARSLLHEICIYRGDEKIVKFFVKRGANPDVHDYEYYTPLMRLDHREKITIQYMLKYSNVNRIFVPYDILSLETGSWCDKYKLILQHIAKMKALDLTVKQILLNAILGREEFKEHFNECTKELELAKSTKIENCWITFFNLLVDSKRKLRKYAGNRDLVEFFEKQDCLKKFPVYGDSIMENVQKGLEIRKAFDKSTEALSNCLPIFNPNHLIIRDTLDYFNLKNYLQLASQV